MDCPAWSIDLGWCPCKNFILISRNVFLHPSQTTATLDHELHSSRSKENQVMILSDRIADNRVRSADVVSNACFRIIFESRFRCCGEGKKANVIRFLDVVTEGRGELPFHGLVITTDREYNFMSVYKTFVEKRNEVVMILSNNLLQYHPYFSR